MGAEGESRSHDLLLKHRANLGLLDTNKRRDVEMARGHYIASTTGARFRLRWDKGSLAVGF